MFFIRSNPNTKIAVYDLNQNSSEVVVMIHGWPLSHRMYEYQTELLTSKGFRVITLDLRGFGCSDAPATGYSYDQMADDIHTVITSLRLKAFTLVGFSMGGAIVIRYMSRYNGYGVKKLALLGAAAPRLTQTKGYPYGVPDSAIDDWISRASTDRPKLCADFGKMLFATPKSPELLNWFTGISEDASGIGTIATAYSLRDEDCRPDLPKIKVPTGIFHGVKDEIVPFELALLQKEGIAGSVLYPFENSGHGVFYDELDLFNSRFLSFLRQRQPPRQQSPE